MNDRNKFTIDVSAWSGKSKLNLSFPRKYEVIRSGFNNRSKNKITKDEIKEKICNPIGSKKIHQLVNEKSQIAIIFDDLSRPSNFSEIASIIIKELLKGKAKKRNIRFICAVGAHGALTLRDFRQKLGKDIVANYPVYNHNPFWGNRFIGNTDNGIPIYINEELYQCDIIIGLGAVLPHINMGFSGGAKIILPGCSGIETIKALHSVKPQEKMKLWRADNNFLRDIIDKTGKTCKLDFIVNVLLNGKLEITDVFAGDSILAFKEASNLAKYHYDSRLELESDVVIVNMFSRENESFVGQILGIQCLKESGGILIIIAESGIGQVTHYLTGNFGKYFKSSHFVEIKKPNKIKKEIIFSSIPDRSSQDWWLEENDKIIWATNWKEVLKIIEKDYPEKAKITFIEDGGMQYDSKLNIEI